MSSFRKEKNPQLREFYINGINNEIKIFKAYYFDTTFLFPLLQALNSDLLYPCQ
jgi:hypothetical protein